MNFKDILNKKKKKSKKEKKSSNINFKLNGLFVIGLMIISLVPINAVGEPNFNGSNPTERYDSRVIRINNTTSIQEAIDNAEPGDTILLGNGTYTGEGNYNIHVNKRVNIKAMNDSYPVINAENNGRVFILDSNNILLEGLTITGGFLKRLDEYGAGICIWGSNNTVNNCTIANNNANLGGAGVFIYNDNDKIINSNIYNNTAVVSAGIHIMKTNNVDISGCNIINNTATGSYTSSAGGVYIDANNHQCKINYNRFLDNKGGSADDVGMWDDNYPGNYNWNNNFDVNYNWWGTNNLTTKQVQFLPDNHYVIRLSANNKSSINNDSFTFGSGTNVDLRYNLVLNSTDEADNHRLPYFMVNNILNNKSSVLDARNEYSYSQNLIYPDNISLESVVDNEDINLQVRSEFIPPEPLHDIYVSVNGDDKNDGDTPKNPVATVNHALDLAENGGTVHILTDLNLEEQININKDIHIKGETLLSFATLDGMNQRGIMLINPNLNVDIERIIFQNAEVNGDGGAIGNNRSSLYIDSCIFRNNHASGYGGAVCSVQDQIDGNSNGLKFSESRIPNYFSFLPNFPFSRYREELKSKELKISNSIFENNSASNSSVIYNTAFNFNLTNCDFINNTIDHDTNAILSFTHEFYIENCNLTSDFDAIKDNKLYTELALYNFNSSSKNKGEYLKTGCFKISKEEKDDFAKDGFYNIYYDNSNKFLRFDDLEQEEDDTDIAMFYAYGECKKNSDKISEPKSFPKMPKMDNRALLDVGTAVDIEVVEEGTPVGCSARFTAFTNTWYGKLIIGSVTTGISTFLGWLISFLSKTEKIVSPTFFNVEMKEGINAFVGDKIPIKLTLQFKNISKENAEYEDIPDGRYNISYNKLGDGKLQTEEFDFKDGVSEFDYTIPAQAKTISFKFSQLKYHHEFKKDYYFEENTKDKEVFWTLIPTLTNISINSTKAKPGDVIQVRFNISENKTGYIAPIDSGEYNLGISQGFLYDNPITNYNNVRVENGEVTVDYTLKEPIVDILRITGVFLNNGKYKNSGSGSIDIPWDNANDRRRTNVFDSPVKPYSLTYKPLRLSNNYFCSTYIMLK